MMLSDVQTKMYVVMWESFSKFMASTQLRNGSSLSTQVKKEQVRTVVLYFLFFFDMWCRASVVSILLLRLIRRYDIEPL